MKELFFITGPSGAGKTTLLNVAGGLQRPDSGSVIMDGIDVYKLTEKKRAQLRAEYFSYVFQYHYLLEDYTCLENISLPLIIRGINPSEARNTVLNMLDSWEMRDIQNEKAGILSGGQKQKTSLLRAFVTSPKVVFCDEPTGNLDSKWTNETAEILKQYHRNSGALIIIVTHNHNFTDLFENAGIVHMKDGTIYPAESM